MCYRPFFDHDFLSVSCFWRREARLVSARLDLKYLLTILMLSQSGPIFRIGELLVLNREATRIR
jgi:hypothetical protein